MPNKWIAKVATGEFLFGGYYEPTPWIKAEQPQQPPGTYDPDTDVVIVLGDRHPDPRTERWDGATSTRPATAPEIAAWDAAETDRQCLSTLDGLKIIKAIALWAGERFGLTPAQVRAEVLAKFRSL